MSEIFEKAGGAAIEFLTTEEFLERWLASKEAAKTKGTLIRHRGVLENILEFIGDRKAGSNIASIAAADIEARAGKH